MNFNNGFERDAVIANNVFLFLAGREEWEDVLEWMHKHVRIKRLLCGSLVVAEGTWDKVSGDKFDDSDIASVVYDGRNIKFVQKSRKTTEIKDQLSISTEGAVMNPIATLARFKYSYSKAA
jgi:hypothetical protein